MERRTSSVVRRFFPSLSSRRENGARDGEQVGDKRRASRRNPVEELHRGQPSFGVALFQEASSSRWYTKTNKIGQLGIAKVQNFWESLRNNPWEIREFKFRERQGKVGLGKKVDFLQKHLLFGCREAKRPLCRSSQRPWSGRVRGREIEVRIGCEEMCHLWNFHFLPRTSVAKTSSPSSSSPSSI
nr:hypothetical protein Iba_chr04aCG10720 [Ipomoea batatas]